jgi:hypothetical protein
MSSSNCVFECIPSIRAFGHESSNRTFGSVSSNPVFEHVPLICAFGCESSNCAFGRISSNCMFKQVPSNRAFGHESSNQVFGRVPSTRAFGRESSNCVFEHVQSLSNHIFRSIASSFSPLSSVLLQNLLILPKKFEDRIFDPQVVRQGIG